jgi:uncharacterized membrane protein
MARVSLRRPGERADLSVPRGSPQMGARYDADAFGRFAEGMARFLGTGRFIVGQTVLVVGWIVLNTVGAIKHWDPYPFILLNLVFSTQAAYAAPLILLSQNRQADTDRIKAEHDYRINQIGLRYLVALHRDAHGSDCDCVEPTEQDGEAERAEKDGEKDLDDVS